MRKKGLTAILAIVFLLLPTVSHALTDEQKVLVGLKGVYVLVEGMNPQAERLGLTRDQIKTDVELRLRKAGVRVLTQEEMLKTPGKPFLYVMVNPVIKADLCAYSIKVKLKELVTLDRGFRTYGTIWDTGVTGTIVALNIRQIRETAGDQVDIFINDYLAANPK